jgi:hypothetical protein
MADQFANIVVPQLQFDKPADNKGTLITTLSDSQRGIPLEMGE